MLVYQAETGREIVSPILANVTTLGEFQDVITEMTGVPVSDQIVMTSDGDPLREEHLKRTQTSETSRVWSDSPSASPKITFSTSDNFIILVYDRQLFVGESGGEGLVEAPELEQVEQQGYTRAIGQLRQRAKRGSVRERCDAYAELFWYHHRRGQAYARAAIVNAAYCEQLVEEQRMQVMALGVAQRNLHSHVSTVIQTFEQLRTTVQKELTKRDNLLRRYEDISVNYYSQALLVDTDGVLARDVTKRVIRDTARACLDHHESVMDEMKLVTNTVRDIQDSNTLEQRKPLSIDLASLDIALNETEVRMQQLEQHAQVFERACERNDQFIRDAVDRFVQTKHHLTIELLNRLQQVSRIQSSIAALSPHLNHLNVAITEQSEKYNMLLHIHRMPIAYGACLVEIARRHEYTEVMLRVAGELAEAMAKTENFASEVRQYIPFSIPGIDDKPPQYEISTNLASNESLPMLTNKMSMSQMTPETGGANDSPLLSINKLHATMLKMMHQLDNLPVDFERVIYKTSTGGLDKSEAVVKANVFGSQLNVNRNRSTTPQLSIRGSGHGTARSRSTSRGSGHNSPVEEMITPLTEKVKFCHSDPTPQPPRSESPPSLGSTHLTMEMVQKELNEEKERYDTLKQQYTKIENDYQSMQSREMEQQQTIERLIMRTICNLDEYKVQNTEMTSTLTSVQNNLDQWTSTINDRLKMASKDRATIQSTTTTTTTLAIKSTLELALKEANDQLEEWEMLCRMSCEQLQLHYQSIKDMMTMSELKNLSTLIDTSTYEHDNTCIANDSTDKPDNNNSNNLLLPNPWFNRTEEETSMMTSSIEILIKRIPISPLTPIDMDTITSNTTSSNSAPLVRSRDALLDLYREMTRLSAETTTVALNELVPKLHQWSNSLQKEMQHLRNENHNSMDKLALHGRLADSITFRNFKVNDLVLFLPTRNPNAWAAFNIDAPHYFLHITERFEHYTRKRDWIVAKILKILPRQIPSSNPFDLPDSTNYYLIEAKYHKSRSETTESSESTSVIPRNTTTTSMMIKEEPISLPSSSHQSSMMMTSTPITRSRSSSSASLPMSPTSPRPPRTSSMPPTRLVGQSTGSTKTRTRPMSMLASTSNTSTSTSTTDTPSSSTFIPSSIPLTTASGLRRLLSRRSQPPPAQSSSSSSSSAPSSPLLSHDSSSNDTTTTTTNP
ncbi:hypothetical protein BDF22DRAFT_739415 [Syncephalis plumigaleata]|nr:hypothetical protein BDF22DRAFT_739415 [Syncephalis plumigaleata]